MKSLWYAWKGQASGGWLALLAILAAMIALLLNDAFRRLDAPRQADDLAVILEVYLPLTLAVLLARAPVLDRESGAAELHLTWRRPAALQLLLLLAIPLILWAAAVLGAGWIAHRWYLALTWRQVFAMAAYPAAGLAGAALAGSALARHQVGGILAAALWWALDLQAPGRLNRWAYLFNSFQPHPDLTPATMHRHLLLLGLAGLAVSLWLAGRRQRWIAGAATAE